MVSKNTGLYALSCASMRRARRAGPDDPPVFVRRSFVFGQRVRLTPLALERGLKSRKMTGRGVVVAPGHTPLSVVVHPEGLRAPSGYAWDFWAPEKP